jgi:hypothetical protein
MISSQIVCDSNRSYNCSILYKIIHRAVSEIEFALLLGLLLLLLLSGFLGFGLLGLGLLGLGLLSLGLLLLSVLGFLLSLLLLVLLVDGFLDPVIEAGLVSMIKSVFAASVRCEMGSYLAISRA